MCVTWRIHMCDTTHSCVCHDVPTLSPSCSIAFVPKNKSHLFHRFVILAYGQEYHVERIDNSFFIRETWRIHECDMMHSGLWHDAFRCVTWRIHVCDTTHSCVWHDSFKCVTWLFHMYDWNIRMCDTTHLYVCHDLPNRASHLFHRLLILAHGQHYQAERKDYF